MPLPQVISTRPAGILMSVNDPCIPEQLVKLAKIRSSHQLVKGVTGRSPAG